MSGYDKIVARNFGGPEVLELVHFDDLPEPGEGEARVRVEAAGVGYTDTIVRRGRYILYKGGLPVTPGYDMVGVVNKLGAGLTGESPELHIGGRVADMSVHGGYSQFILRPARDLIAVPAGVDPVVAVEVPLMWVTAWQMLTRTVSLERGATILVVGASGAVGRALVLLGRHYGCRVIGTCSAANLASLEALGATAVDHRRSDLEASIRTASGGVGVAAAFDAIGGASWQTSWSVLANGGKLVGYGMQDFLESGAPGSEAGKSLAQFNETWNSTGASDGSRRSTTFYDINLRRRSHPDEYRADAEHLLQLIAEGKVVPPAAEVLSLDQAAEAHHRVAKGGLQQRLVIRP
jgi:NADPH:quinone reductase-like Zn-dependent oxidoreductase